MKNKLFVAVAAAVGLVTTTAPADGLLTNSKFFSLREEIRRSNNDYFRLSKCRELIGDPVDMRGRVQTVDKYATIMVDLDTDSVLSMPDVSLSLLDDSEAVGIEPPQTIVFHGSVSSCNYVPFTRTLHIGVRNGHLVRHY